MEQKEGKRCYIEFLCLFPLDGTEKRARVRDASGGAACSEQKKLEFVTVISLVVRGAACSVFRAEETWKVPREGTVSSPQR